MQAPWAVLTTISTQSTVSVQPQWPGQLGQQSPGQVQTTGLVQKFIYTIGNYGLAAADGDPTVDHPPGSLDWEYATLNEIKDCCTSDYSTTSDHMRNCSLDPGHNYFDPNDPGLDPNCKSFDSPDPNCASFREGTGLKQGKTYSLFFDILDSLRERLSLAKIAGLGGVCYWTVGDELNGFFDMVTSIFPDIPQYTITRPDMVRRSL